MAGETASYRIRPAGEWVVGVLTAGAMRASRTGRTFDFGAGDLCLWDASGAHSGTARGGRLWSARLMLVEPPSFEEIGDDPIGRFFTLPCEPVVRRPRLAARSTCTAVANGRRPPIRVGARLWFNDPPRRRLALAAPAGPSRRLRLPACALVKDDHQEPDMDDLARPPNQNPAGPGFSRARSPHRAGSPSD
jgi:hypothetical protein